MKKCKLKTFLTILSVFIILFLYLLSVPASASAVSDNSLTFAPASTSLDFSYSFYNPNYSNLSETFPYLFYSFQPILVDGLYKPSGTYIITDTYNISGAFPFYGTVYTQYVSAPEGLIGVHNFNLLNLAPTENVNFSANLSLQDFVIRVSDFFCWNYNFNAQGYDDIPLVGNEVNFTVGSQVSTDMFIHHIVVRYRTADSSSLNVKVIYSEEDSVYAQNLASGIVDVTPLMLGYTDLDTVIYIDELSVHFGDLPPYAFPRSGFDPVLDVNYTYNPYLSRYIDLGGSGGSGSGDSGDENPALALIPYTTWIGEAVTGFMDFELFKGFTLGGIFVTLLSFTICIWFLKLVAGG